ncbi:MAG: hypothetical protein R3B93_03250 [Bacteroidia bacterium]
MFEINCAPNNGFNGALLDSIVVTPGEPIISRFPVVQVLSGIRAEEVNPSFSAPINDTLCNAIPLIVGGSCNPNNPNGNNMGATLKSMNPWEVVLWEVPPGVVYFYWSSVRDM